jgi:hypothetical protein
MNSIQTIITWSGILAFIGVGSFIFLVKKALDNIDSVEDNNDGSFGKEEDEDKMDKAYETMKTFDKEV